MQEFEGGVPSEEQENKAAKEFLEILHRGPQAFVWKSEDGYTMAEYRETIEVAYEEGGKELRAIFLQTTEERHFEYPSEIHKYHIGSRKLNDDATPALAGEIIAEQLRDIIEKEGNPTRIHYMTTDWKSFPNKKGLVSNSSSISFPFSKISKELGVE